jgi:hypothetical protein
MAEGSTLISLPQWQALLRAERNRCKGSDSDARERLSAMLDEMAHRLRGVARLCRPTPAEKARSTRELECWLRERYGS